MTTIETNEVGGVDLTLVAAVSQLANEFADVLLNAMTTNDIPHKMQVATVCYALAILLNKDESSSDEAGHAGNLIGLFSGMVEAGV